MDIEEFLGKIHSASSVVDVAVLYSERDTVTYAEGNDAIMCLVDEVLDAKRD